MTKGREQHALFFPWAHAFYGIYYIPFYLQLHVTHKEQHARHSTDLEAIQCVFKSWRNFTLSDIFSNIAFANLACFWKLSEQTWMKQVAFRLVTCIAKKTAAPVPQQFLFCMHFSSILLAPSFNSFKTFSQAKIFRDACHNICKVVEWAQIRQSWQLRWCCSFFFFLMWCCR